VYATGFGVGGSDGRSVPFEVLGTGGGSLGKKWQHGTATLFGMMTEGFPNLVFMRGITPGIGAQMVRAGNYMHIALECADLASFLFAHCLEEGIRSFEVTEEAESEWVETIVRKYREMPPSSYNEPGLSQVVHAEATSTTRASLSSSILGTPASQARRESSSRSCAVGGNRALSTGSSCPDDRHTDGRPGGSSGLVAELHFGDRRLA